MSIKLKEVEFLKAFIDWTNRAANSFFSIIIIIIFLMFVFLLLHLLLLLMFYQNQVGMLPSRYQLFISSYIIHSNFKFLFDILFYRFIHNISSQFCSFTFILRYIVDTDSCLQNCCLFLVCKI